MGTLIPEDFDLSRVEHSLAKVTEILRDSTDDEWLILPHVPYVDQGRDGEIDLVLLHPTCGGITLEVKGGRIAVRDGTWLQNDRELDRSPVDQVVDGKHALIRRLKRLPGAGGLSEIRFRHGVVFPDVPAVPDEMLGPDLERQMVLTKLELQWPDQALKALAGETAATPAPVLDRIVRVLRPTVDFSRQMGQHLRGVSRKLGDVTENMIRTAENLFVNDRVLVVGPAGVGKTRLAVSWARRGSREGHRVLLTCFNVPIGSQLATEFAGDERVVAGPFLELVIDWLRSTTFVVPPEPERDSEFYDSLPKALLEHLPEIAVRFDVLILDEVQDFRPDWFDALHALFAPEGPKKEFRLGDERQSLFNADELETEGWTRYPLSTNCRNTRNISAVARRLDEESETFPDCPPGPEVRFRKVRGEREVVRWVKREVEYLVNDQYVSPSDITVICTTKPVRDTVIEQLAEMTFDELAGGLGDVIRVVPWDSRDEDAVVCETAHRLKGTEWHAVILVNLEDVGKFNIGKVLYVGVTRATTWLSVIGTAETGDYLGLRPVGPD